ncbi:DUF4336 domain-containing protein [Pelagovum pacificum]|uniref:DUF4336 domain-containing protein n=1 Tax=Pelagovum pacificum TaxID=2588711 RepID=UPI001E2B880A|nr:DUF4336 domain-containing protein [Pelagovum pacificum]
MAFGTDIWTIDGPQVESMGFRYPTRMALVRLRNGSLWAWSPVALTEELRRAVDGLGPVAHVIAPNSLHHLALPEWQAAYPEATLHAAPGLRRKRADIAFEADLGPEPHPEWAGQIDQVIVRGNVLTEEVVFFHRASGTLIFTDLVQNFPPDHFTGPRRLIARLDRMLEPEATVPRKFGVAFTNKRQARQDIGRIAAWPVRQVLMAHGDPVIKDAAHFVSRAFGWLRY